MYSGIHGLDRLRWLLDSEAVKVYARSATIVHDTDVEDVLMATISYANGATATALQYIAAYPLLPRWRSEIYGDEGTILIAPDQSVGVYAAHRALQLRAQRNDCFIGEIREFVVAIRERRAPAITGADGRAALDTALAIYESARTGRVVTVGGGRSES